MLLTHVILPLLPLTSAISLHGLTRRAPKAQGAPAVAHQHQAVMRNANPGNVTAAAAEGEPRKRKVRRSSLVHPKGTRKAKRVVRRSKKRGNTTCATSSSSADSSPSATESPSASASESASASSTASSSAASPSASSSTGWYHVDTWSGSNFFDNFEFWNYDDPTHGNVDYQSASQAWDQGLVSINSEGHAIMTVDQTQQATGRGRKAVRLHGNKVFTGGLVLMDSYHVPTGCGTWPAWWSNGPNWPYGGEIDILEGVNVYTQNQVSLHTGSGCTMPTEAAGWQTGTYTTGWYDSFNCASYETGNSGCGVRDETHTNAYGKPFNDNRGGVYALLWAKEGFKFWFFPRGSIPDDITNSNPDPTTWGTPIGNFPSTSCDPYEYFYDHFNIFTNTFCGDWAGASDIWNGSGWAGQTESCASITGYSTCEEYVMNVGSAFSEAYWEIGSIQYYNSTTLV